MLESKHELKIVIGLGATGFSCIRYFMARGIEVAVADTRELPPGLTALQEEFPGIEIACGALSIEFLQRATEIILSPGISLQQPVIQACLAQGIPVIGDIEVFARAIAQPVIAITGSNAKSTVTSLVGLMAQKAGINVLVGGNIGVPVLDLLRQPSPDLYVLELSSFQLETTFSLQPTAATILNISADHMDRYASYTDYMEAKQRIYQQAMCVICNRDDQQTYPVNTTAAPMRTFGLAEPQSGEYGIQYQDQVAWLSYGRELLLATSELRIKGRHNWANALAALALGQAAGLNRDAMLSALREFPGLAHRCEWLTEQQGAQWYNDSKGTNVGATVAALQGIGAGLTGKIILIAGGDGKGADFTELAPTVARYVRLAILLGKDAKILGQSLPTGIPIKYVDSLPAAVQLAAANARSGDAVLLSPACASLDMFQNYEQRGEVFKAAVQELLR